MSSLQVRPAPRSRPPALTLVPAAEPLASAQPMLPMGWAGRPRTVDPELPADAERAVRALCHALAEALAGRRTAAQLRGAVPARIVQLVTAVAHGRQATGMRLASLRLQSPCGHVVEATLRLAGAGRSCAAAVRLEYRDGRWRCVELELAFPGAGVRPPARGTS